MAGRQPIMSVETFIQEGLERIRHGAVEKHANSSTHQVSTTNVLQLNVSQSRYKKIIIIENLDMMISEVNLHDIFSVYGSIESTQVHLDRYGRVRGSGEIIYRNPADALKVSIGFLFNLIFRRLGENPIRKLSFYRAIEYQIDHFSHIYIYIAKEIRNRFPNSTAVLN